MKKTPPKWVRSKTRETHGEYWWGEPKVLGSGWDKVLARAKWACHDAGYELPRLVIKIYTRAWFQPEDGAGYRFGGLAWRTEKTGHIILMARATTSLNSLADTLLHELAHVITHGIETDESHEHSELWGTVYAQIYRRYFDETSHGPHCN